MDLSGQRPPPSPSSPPSGEFAPFDNGFAPVKPFFFRGNAPVSFRDKVLGSGRRSDVEKTADLLAEQLASASWLDGDRLKPAIKLSDSLKGKLQKQWEDALIVSVLGLKIGFLALREILNRLWRLRGKFELLDLGEGFFLVKFDCLEDRESVVDGGPWMVLGRYLAVFPWSPDFSPAKCRIRKTMVWVRLPGLGLLYYDEAVLRLIASMIGKFVKIDNNTLEINRGKFARLCVEINLENPVVSSIMIDGEWQKIEYEGLHLICTKCSCYGHVKADCRKQIREGRDGAVEEQPEQVKAVKEGSNENLGVTATTVVGEDQPGSDDDNDMENGCEIADSGMGCHDTSFSSETGNLPPQPQIGDWVVVSSRRKKKGKSPTKDKASLEQRNGVLKQDNISGLPVQGSSKLSSPNAKMGGRHKGLNLKVKSTHQGGNGQEKMTMGQTRRVDFPSLNSSSLDNNDMPGVKRSRSNDTMNDNQLTHTGESLMVAAMDENEGA